MSQFLASPNAGYPITRKGRYSGYATDGTTVVNANVAKGSVLQAHAGYTTGSDVYDNTAAQVADNGYAFGRPTSGVRTPFAVINEGAMDQVNLNTLNNQGSATANLRDGGPLDLTVCGMCRALVIASAVLTAGVTYLEPVSGQFYLQPCSRPYESLGSVIADSAAVTSTATETVFNKSLTIPASTLNAGDTLLIVGKVIITAQNSTDTLTISGRIGTAGTTGDALFFAGAAIDPNVASAANADISVFSAWLTIRSIGSAGTAEAACHGNTGTRGAQFLINTDSAWVGSNATDTTLAINTLSANIISITATWSTTSASNSCKLVQLSAAKFGASNLGLGPIAIAMESKTVGSSAELTKVMLTQHPF